MKHRISIPEGVSLPATMTGADFQALIRTGRPPSPTGTAEAAPRAKAAIRLPAPQKMTNVEEEYERILQTQYPAAEGYEVKYEAITLRLPGGAKYTPDFSVWIEDRLLLLVETKGSYRLGSAGRAHLAFGVAKAAYPHLRFKFAQRLKGGEWVFA